MSSPRFALAARIVCGLLAALLVFSALVQLNDPDPLPWFSVYAAGALVCGVAVLRRVPFWLPLGLSAVTFGWALSLLPRFVGHGDYVELLNMGGGMTGEASEYAREASGLFIETAAMGFVAVGRRLSRR